MDMVLRSMLTIWFHIATLFFMLVMPKTLHTNSSLIKLKLTPLMIYPTIQMKPLLNWVFHTIFSRPHVSNRET